ncbi:hypothetical protein GCM10029992_51470 [Glycomyces albus]
MSFDPPQEGGKEIHPRRTKKSVDRAKKPRPSDVGDETYENGFKGDSMKPLYSRRIRLGLAVLASAGVGASMLSACSSDDGDGVTLRFNWWGEDTRHGLTQEIIDAFEQEHPDITVQAEFSNYDDYWNKLSTSAAAQDLPDIMQVTDPFMYSYIDNGQLLDLTEVEGTVDLESFPEETLSLSTVDGGIRRAGGHLQFRHPGHPGGVRRRGPRAPRRPDLDLGRLHRRGHRDQRGEPRGPRRHPAGLDQHAHRVAPPAR